MKQAITRISVLCCLVILTSCSSAPAQQTNKQRLAALLADPDFSSYEMRTVVNSAYEAGELSTMLTALWRLCQRSVAVAGGIDDCSDYLDVAVILKDKPAQSQAYMALYFLTQEPHYHQRAKAVLPGDNAYYQQVLIARLEDCLDETNDSEPLALQCYISGKHFQNEQALIKALTLFERYNAKHNIADTYFVLAQLVALDNRQTQAETFAARAALILSQLGEAQKARQVRQWRQDVLYAK